VSLSNTSRGSFYFINQANDEALCCLKTGEIRLCKESAQKDKKDSCWRIIFTSQSKYCSLLHQAHKRTLSCNNSYHITSQVVQGSMSNLHNQWRLVPTANGVCFFLENSREQRILIGTPTGEVDTQSVYTGETWQHWKIDSLTNHATSSPLFLSGSR